MNDGDGATNGGEPGGAIQDTMEQVNKAETLHALRVMKSRRGVDPAYLLIEVWNG